jgi:hypothetical protein
MPTESKSPPPKPDDFEDVPLKKKMDEPKQDEDPKILQRITSRESSSPGNKMQTRNSSQCWKWILPTSTVLRLLDRMGCQDVLNN